MIVRALGSVHKMALKLIDYLKMIISKTVSRLRLQMDSDTSESTVGSNSSSKLLIDDFGSRLSPIMKKRYVKRLIRKLVYFVGAILLISLITTWIVERRIKNENTLDDLPAQTDMNGDPVTAPFHGKLKIKTNRKPRPPMQWLQRRQEQLRQNEAKSDEPVQFPLPQPHGRKIDWNDYAAIEADRKRVGPGEQGAPTYISDPFKKELEKNLSLRTGFNALVSEMISVNRSVPDVRKDGCKNRQYLADLPSFSVVIPCHNEHFHTLLRTIYSIINRSPSKLLRNIVVVDDGSEAEDLKEKLDEYVQTHWPDLVQVIHLPDRKGLINARLAGAREATGDVLVFFDSHIEVGYNWVPPLLEPIAINRKVSTCPIVDVIEHGTFAYTGGYQEGSRGAFDWYFSYKQLAVLPEDSVDKTQPYRNPVMMGGLFAIESKFFWELGGYDEGLDIWGAEQFELSFKIWMCGGMLLDVPCSRVAHIFRGPWESGGKKARDYNFLVRNQKRVAEVWMDEYKQYIYDRDLDNYNNVSAGDLTAQFAVRERLKCKSFKWYLEEVAPDVIKHFPPVEPPPYASGVVQSLVYPNFCLDCMNKGSENPVGMFYCAEDKLHPQHNQLWVLSSRRDLRLQKQQMCLDVSAPLPNATVMLWHCHDQGGNQFWSYDRRHKWLMHRYSKTSCLEAFQVDDGYSVVVNVCDAENPRMKWEFGFVNNTALDHFWDNARD